MFQAVILIVLLFLVVWFVFDEGRFIDKMVKLIRG